MKTKIAFIICAIIFTLPIMTLGGNDKSKKIVNKNSCLEITGRLSVLSIKKSSRFISVLLYKNNLRVDSITIPARNSFKFILEKNEIYAIKIIQDGFVSRLISISTEIPENINNQSPFKFFFDLIPLSCSEAVSINSDILDFPVALINYDTKKGYFDYREEYSEFIKEEIVINMGD